MYPSNTGFHPKAVILYIEDVDLNFNALTGLRSVTSHPLH